MTKVEAKARAVALLTKFGLLDFKDKYPGQLSGGMKRRVELAQALINNPDLMILDEPFRGLDIMTRELMQEYYLKLFEETRLTTSLITSDMEEAIFLADRVLVMSGAPAKIVKAIEVDLPHPRRLEALVTDRYLAIKEDVMAADMPMALPEKSCLIQEPGATRPIAGTPHAGSIEEDRRGQRARLRQWSQLSDWLGRR